MIYQQLVACTEPRKAGAQGGLASANQRNALAIAVLAPYLEAVREGAGRTQELPDVGLAADAAAVLARQEEGAVNVAQVVRDLGSTSTRLTQESVLPMRLRHDRDPVLASK